MKRHENEYYKYTKHRVTQRNRYLFESGIDIDRMDDTQFRSYVRLGKGQFDELLRSIPPCGQERVPGALTPSVFATGLTSVFTIWLRAMHFARLHRYLEYRLPLLELPVPLALPALPWCKLICSGPPRIRRKHQRQPGQRQHSGGSHRTRSCDALHNDGAVCYWRLTHARQRELKVQRRGECC
jgi:hypothetical protein